jgi:hypothetical protein
VTRLDAHGALLWSRLVATSPSGDWAPLDVFGQDESPIAVGSDGTIVLGGPFTDGIDLGEGLLEASHGLFLIKLADDGTPLWKQAFAGTKPTGWDSSRTGSVFVDDSGVITWFGTCTG